MGSTVPVAAVSLGACIIEKHFTLSRNLKGPDSEFSMEPDEFMEMVNAVRSTEAALGCVQYGTSQNEGPSRVFRRSLFVVKDIAAGELFTEDHVRSIRPGYGLHTRHMDEVMACRAARDISRGTPLQWNLIHTRRKSA